MVDEVICDQVDVMFYEAIQDKVVTALVGRANMAFSFNSRILDGEDDKPYKSISNFVIEQKMVYGLPKTLDLHATEQETFED